MSWLLFVTSAHTADQAPTPKRLSGTDQLDWADDIASRMVAGADRFLLGELERAVARRGRFWDRDFDSHRAYDISIQPNRARLAHMLGVRDPRHAVEALSLVGTTNQSPVVAENQRLRVVAVRWPVLGRMHGEGLLLLPRDKRPLANVVAIPHAGQTPEALCGLVAGVNTASQFPRRLAESGCQVLVPAIVDRDLQPRNGRAVLTSREYLYRSAFELGRHLIGYELQKVLAAVDWFDRESPAERSVGVVGWGEGGMLALYAAALDPRIDSACVSGHFQPREAIWQQPIDRNVFGLLEQFGDAELASMVAPRPLIIEAARGPELILASGKGGAPGQLDTPSLQRVRDEFQRARDLVSGLSEDEPLQLLVSDDGHGPYLTASTLQPFLDSLAPDSEIRESQAAPAYQGDGQAMQRRAKRQVEEIDDHNQWLLRESAYVRREFMKDLDTSSLEAYERSLTKYRDLFRDEVIGSYSLPLSPPNVRSRQSYETDGWLGYEVVLDVYEPDLFAYGILLVPKDLQPGEQRPVVVCQHGLEGRPQQLIEGDHRAYHDFAAALAERGFIVFAPQHPYIFGDRFRTLQRKANPLKKTLFSLMVAQHQQIIKWLGSLEYVDPERIGFYGLSYGGKSAMRIPALVDGYCLSICSADFNEWVWKNASTRAKYSYVWTGEYEIFEFDLGSTFNYAEMAALIAPRPFMVERGHFDAVAPDEKVAHEFAKVRRLYAAQLKIPDRCAIEWFVGPHTINGKGTFEFLHQHLDWPLK
jgi:dienelactone hydrolase